MNIDVIKAGASAALVAGVLLSGAVQEAIQAAPGAGQGGGRGAGAPACTTVACDVQGDWERSRGLIVGIANAMPEDKWTFKSTPAQRSYGEQVMHIVQTDLRLIGTLGAKTPAPAVNEKAASKADVMAALQQSMDYGAAVIKEFDDAALSARVKSLPFMGPTVSRLRVIYFSISHSQDIYGQMAVYLRLNGVTPPASNRGI
jgi:uncharacterized damage-inducible protein DinB